MISYKGKIEYPKAFRLLAYDIGMYWSSNNSELQVRRPEMSRGSKSFNIKVHTMGALGEMIFRHFLDLNEITFEASSFIAPKPLSQADVYIDGVGYDVKYKHHYTKEFRVNEQAHNKEVKNRSVQHYVFVEPAKDKRVASIFVADKMAVSNWQLIERKEKHRSNYYALEQG